MLSPATVLTQIEDERLVVGMRGAFPPETALEVAEICMDAGFSIFEFTMNSEKPIEAMQAVKNAYGDDCVAGMGTVIDLETSKRVLDAEPDFVVSPAFQPEIVQYFQKADVFIAPGVFTPSECVQAWEMGVKLLKIFPVGPAGLDYFNAVRGPLSHMKFMCNGGTDGENTREFLNAGAVAIGMGAWLTGDGTRRKSELRSRAQILRNTIDSVNADVPVSRVI